MNIYTKAKKIYAACIQIKKNIAGVPSISVPCGTHTNGLPMGIQIMGDYFAETKVMALAKEVKGK